jgi:hypothetical protein
VKSPLSFISISGTLLGLASLLSSPLLNAQTVVPEAGPVISSVADSLKKPKKDTIKQTLFPRFILYISPGIGGNVGKQHGQIQKSDVTDLVNTSYILHGVRNEQPGFDYDVGFQFTVLSTQKLFLRVGVGIENIVYNGIAKGTVSHFDKTGALTDSVQEEWSYTYQDEFLQVPLSLSYRISEEGKNYMGINLGVTGSCLLQETCSGIRTDGYTVKGKYAVFGSGGFIYVFPSKRPGEGSLSIEPEMKYMLDPMSDRRVFWTVGLKVGVAFGFNKAAE